MSEPTRCDYVSPLNSKQCRFAMGHGNVHDCGAFNELLASAGEPRSDSASAPVTAAEITALAFQYDQEYRGGTGRGEIDDELAERLAVWFNSRRLATGLPPGDSR